MAIEINDAELEADFSAAMATTGAMEAATAEAAGAKKLFCDNWPMAKSVLEALAGLAPGFAKIAIMAAIKAGDIAHKLVCRA